VDEKEVDKVEEIEECWNGLISNLIASKESWEKFQELLGKGGMPLAEMSGTLLNRYASMFGRQEFLLAIPGLLGHCKGYRGSLDELLVIREVEEEKEEE